MAITGLHDLPFATNQNIQACVTATSGGSNELYAAPGASKRIAVANIIVSNLSATSAQVTLKSGSTTIAKIPAPSDGVSGGCVIELLKPLRCAENEALSFTAANGISVTFVGYIEPVPANSI